MLSLNFPDLESSQNAKNQMPVTEITLLILSNRGSCLPARILSCQTLYNAVSYIRFSRAQTILSYIYKEQWFYVYLKGRPLKA